MYFKKFISTVVLLSLISVLFASCGSKDSSSSSTSSGAIPKPTIQ